MGVKIYTLHEKYSCSNCGKVYKNTSRDLNFAFATERIYLGPSTKICSRCGYLRKNDPYTEYLEKSFIEKVLLHLGFFTKYKLMEPISAFIDMAKDNYGFCFKTWDYIVTTFAGLFAFIIILLQIITGIFVWIATSIWFIPIGVIINNLKIYKSIIRNKK